MIFSVMGT